MALRLSKITVLFIIAANMTLVASNNVFDYNSNYEFVQHVMSMDTTFPDNALMWRSVNSSFWWNLCYILIILTEFAIAVLCWIGLAKMFKYRKHDFKEFNSAKSFAVAGLTLSLLLYGFVFITIAGEWFLMWQSARWNGEQSALKMVLMAGVALIFISTKD